MRFEGVLSAWNHDTGYGAISPAGGGDEVFVALAAFPTDGEGARLDEPLSFEIVTARDGRKEAVNLRRLQRTKPSPSAAMRQAAGAGAARVRQSQRKRRLGLLAGGAALAMLLVAGGMHWLKPAAHAAEVPALSRR